MTPKSPFSDLPEHLYMPAVRRIQPLPMKKDGQVIIGLRDPFELSKETIALPANIFAIVQQINGTLTAEEIATKTKAPPEQFIELLEKLDEVGLLWGPTAAKLEQEALSKIKADGTFAIRSSGPLGKTPKDCSKRIDGWFNETEDPEFDKPIHAIVAPHLDYDRGWPNYACAYYAWQNADNPDRVVILGTNHFGNGDGVVLSTIGFSSPFGTCPVDKLVVEKLAEKLGSGLTTDMLDHLAEHSIELQLPWLQHCFGNVPIVAALVPSPLIPMIENDGERTTTTEFVEALQAILDEVGGTTYFVASADLSHVGQQFGEPRAVDDQRKFDVEKHDREMMAKFIQGDAEEFVDAMKWNNNATQWCSIGNMSALMQLAKANSIELIDYRQWCDDNGIALVSSCSMALLS
ncbi:MAG: AmmeMemoRadiSam system protein B [Phycisphaerales bacterium]|nr:AmmeMemoRadiSam system protein B [PVC group bacterium]MBL6998200.1 AmmeMemoRadiSam system protein B [Phycisphaerales bacterium]